MSGSSGGAVKAVALVGGLAVLGLGRVMKSGAKVGANALDGAVHAGARAGSHAVDDAARAGGHALDDAARTGAHALPADEVGGGAARASAAEAAAAEGEGLGTRVVRGTGEEAAETGLQTAAEGALEDQEDEGE